MKGLLGAVVWMGSVVCGSAAISYPADGALLGGGTAMSVLVRADPDGVIVARKEPGADEMKYPWEALTPEQRETLGLTEAGVAAYREKYAPGRAQCPAASWTLADLLDRYGTPNLRSAEKPRGQLKLDDRYLAIEKPVFAATIHYLPRYVVNAYFAPSQRLMAVSIEPTVPDQRDGIRALLGPYRPRPFEEGEVERILNQFSPGGSWLPEGGTPSCYSVGDQFVAYLAKKGDVADQEYDVLIIVVSGLIH